MHRVRSVLVSALLPVLVVSWLGGAPGGPPSARAGAAAWPTSTLVVSEVQTGGASASDEFVEIANQGPAPVDLAGLEVVYATSSGSTVTRKTMWGTSLVLDAGRRFLLVNSVGVYAGIGDATYTGGFAATGGAIALRVVGGAVVDAVGWGDASNAFVEGTAAPTPASGSSLERRPGGTLGNGTDTNDGLADFLVSATPGPQGLAAAPVPSPAGSPTPPPTSSPTVLPTPTATMAPTLPPTPTPTVAPTPAPTDEPMSTPTLTPTPTPTLTPTVAPTPTTAPTATPTVAPTATPTIAPTPAPTADPVTAIADARLLPDAAPVTVVGILTTDLGALESGRTAFLQDSSGGIAIYLDAVGVSALPRGTEVAVAGTTGSRFAQAVIRANETDIEVLGFPGVPAELAIDTGAATEPVEGLRLALSGVMATGIDSLSDGSAVTIDDGSGPARLVITPAALAGRTLASGETLRAIGPLGQRDSTGAGTSGYRLYVVDPADLLIEPAPTPTPTIAPTPTPTPTPTATVAPTASPTSTPSVAPTTTPSASTSPSPTATASASPTSTPASTTSSIAQARARPVGSVVDLRGVVTAESGRLGTPPLIAIADATGGIVVKLPDDAPRPTRGQVVVVHGTLADPYGQLEVRPTATGLRIDGTGALPLPLVLASAALGETVEARLVQVTAQVAERPTKASSGDLTVVIETPDGTRTKVAADASAGFIASSFEVGASFRFTGIVGQRASRKGALDGYRIWLRDAADRVPVAGPGPSPSPTSTPSPTKKPHPNSSPTPGPKASDAAPATVSIAHALGTSDRELAVEGVVTAPALLLDSTGRRVVVQDASGAIEVLIGKDLPVPAVGDRIKATGKVGSAYGSPRLRATALEQRGHGAAPAPLVLHGAPTDAQAWRLVSIRARVDDVKKLGDRWRAELVLGDARIVVVGQPGAAIPITAIVEGRTATVVGIVRRAYPSASDKRPTILPRTSADIRLEGAASGAGTTGATGAGSGTSGGSGANGATSPGAGVATAGPGTEAAIAALLAVPAADLGDLATLDGQQVRVGGLVRELRPDGFRLDDGTAVGTVLLAGAALDWLALIEPDDAINVVGRVSIADTGPVVTVDDPGSIVLGADLVAPSADPGATAAGLTGPSSASGDPAAQARQAGMALDPAGLPGAGAGVGSLLLIALASLLVTALRRRHARRLLASRVATRLATLAATAPSTGPATSLAGRPEGLS